MSYLTTPTDITQACRDFCQADDPRNAGRANYVAACTDDCVDEWRGITRATCPYCGQPIGTGRNVTRDGDAYAHHACVAVAAKSGEPF